MYHYANDDVYSVAGVFPGQSYSVYTIRDALQKFYGAKIMLNCDRNGQLHEVMLYFYVRGRDDYEITDAFGWGSCRGRVWYPKK